jgi:hypothetical protein
MLKLHAHLEAAFPTYPVGVMGIHLSKNGLSAELKGQKDDPFMQNARSSHI